MVFEDENNGKLTTTCEPTPSAAVYQAGVNLQYPHPSNADFKIDIAPYDAATLASGYPSKNPFPLVIRLDTLTDKALAEGHTIEEVVPAAAQPDWVYSLTTYIGIVSQAGIARPTVIQQVVWMAGMPYQLMDTDGFKLAVPVP
ncbi:hypothetical protein WJX73_009726 [Symbiochloris irregularis]|uniref:Uncharacterized protein n=1 Tax=Symbiochloris irregularis TaxID=706552 RepID=A0AAW1P532_9CHLO